MLPLELQQAVDPEGRLLQAVDVTVGEMEALYRWMVLGRVFDERAVALQRQGRIGTYAPFAGQEAAIVGPALALQPQDWIFPTYREVLAGMIHGVPIDRYLLTFKAHGLGGRMPDGANVFPIQISIATHIPHAVGAAWAAKLSGHDAVALVYFGDGATSKGDFHEALNWAGVFSVPVVFVCNNNQWAISIPRGRQTASATLAQKALAYGFEGVLVDGMDALAVYQAARAAIKRAREGGGPTLIEAVCYRYGPHTTADDPTRYRDPEELARWQALDPIARMRRLLVRQGLWDDARDEELWQLCRDRVAQAVEVAERHPPSEVAMMFDHAYGAPPPHVTRQRRGAVGG